MGKSNESRSPGMFGWLKRLITLSVLGALGAAGFLYWQHTREVAVLKKMIARLTAESHVADVWVESIKEEQPGKQKTLRLKILEYGPGHKPLTPVFCTFHVNDVIHFEALVIRLTDALIMDGKGKSIHLFRRAFALDDAGNSYESCNLNKPMEVPDGYRLPGADAYEKQFEEQYWRSFWRFALDENSRKQAGVKNAQIEAPATRFVPEKIYRLKLEHDGGLFIEARDVPEILKGENVPSAESK